MEPLGFSHIYFAVSDLDRSEAFYRDVIGFDVLGRGLINEPQPNSTLTTTTRQRVVLVEYPDLPVRPNSNNVHHAFWLEPVEYERAVERLKERGMVIEDPRAQFRPLGELSVDVHDPDGHWFQIQAHTSKATEILVENVGEIKCGNVDDYAVGDVKIFPKGKFFVTRLEDGFIALSRWCTHRNGLLVWKPEHWCFQCPMHNVTYNRKGQNTHFWKKVPPMRTHPLAISPDGAITVNPDVVIERESFQPSDVVRVSAVGV